MPILDPFLSSILLKYFELKLTIEDDLNQSSSTYLVSFFSKYLKIASDNLYQNVDTIESSKQFKKDLYDSISVLNELFKLHLTTQIFDFPIQNYYKYLYKFINSGNFESYGNCYVLSDKFQTKVFLFNKHSHHFYWIFLETPVAILCITGFDKRYFDLENEYRIIILEIDLLIASGFTLVLCAEVEINDLFHFDLFHSIYCTHKFTEIHINLHFNLLFPALAKNYYHLYDEYLEKLLNDFDQINGYFYLYSPFTISSKSEEIMQKLKQKPRFNFILFSTNSLHDASESYPFVSFNFSKPFPICENGFDFDKIRIKLLNAPLYNTDDEENDVIPSEISDICISYINAKDFYYWRRSRVKVLYIDSKNNRSSYKYVNFDDIHLIRPDMCVKKTIYLTKTKNKTLTEIKKIQDESNKLSEKNDVFKQKNIISLLKSSKIQKTLAYAIYAYENYAKPLIHQDFHVHTNQIFTAYEACKRCIKYNKNPKKKGIVYQVETGEGKSCIVCLIAAVLALMKKTVHISSSNIKLSNRDYYESYHFFKKFDLTSAVLLHYNELPYISFNNLQNDENDYNKQYFPDMFFEEKLFKNSSNMNFSVCGIDNENNVTSNKANIIFSTFVNFECLYLKMMEMCPAYITQYFKNCSLLIDEADSILIDELTNGTILSRSLKTNGNEILPFVYQSFLQKKIPKDVFYEVKNKWPKCVDITLNDIVNMYHEIELIQQNEFSNGKKYSIETVEYEEESNKSIKELFKKKELNKPKTYKQIIPFDYDHKGILEPNKEFSGFIQQFIAIKEMLSNEENKNMIIKDVSMNYLFVSHPIFVSLYDSVCGLTGTIGGKYDKKILKEQYKLATMKVPRENPNYCVEFPILLCKNIEERNKKIVSEIMIFHERGNPVLIIFQELNEINTVYNLLISQGIKSINIFDGKDEKIKPDKMSGKKGAISLGTNVCGRGTDIKNPVKPLHVIITYYTSNMRVLQQAFGRTARQGNKGSVRIICLLDQFISPIDVLNENEMKNVLNDFVFKNNLQMEYIDKFKSKREWIFSTNIKPQKLSSDDIEILREAKINVNRINAYNYIFPICMSIPTFLKIQAQKIFSLYNCPNSKYTWMLFQNYIREMILESWSLFIDKTEKQFFQAKLDISFQDYLKSECKNLFKLLFVYLPECKNQHNYGIVPTFMHIFNLVLKQYEDIIMKTFPDGLQKFFKQSDRKSFSSFTIGFKPFSLLNESGSRINTVDGTNQDINYIKDPELKYMQRMPNNCFSILSITQKIDGIFNWICLKINKAIGSHIGLKFFLRRTLGGCEFGVCYDFNLENVDENILIDQNCLVDKDPLFIFTISVKSMIPILAGILIIGLVYISSISKSISEWIMAFPAKITQKLILNTLKEVASLVLSSQIERLCEVLCKFLIGKLEKQIEKLKHYKPKVASIFKLLMNISNQKNFAASGDMINNLFQGKTKLKIENCFFDSFINNNNIPTGAFLKIGFILMLCFSSFMMNFHLHRKSVNYDSKRVAAEYDKNQNPEESLTKNINVVEENKINKIDFDLDINEE